MPTDKCKIISENLRRLDEAVSSTLEKRLAHLNEIAAFLCDEAGEDEIFFRDAGFIEKYRSVTSGIRKSVPDSAAPFNRKKLLSLENAAAPRERAFICRRLTDLLGIKGIKSAGTFFDESVIDGNDRVSYMKNSYADVAYRRFSKMLGSPKVIYGNDFTEVCENVYYGKSEYCILPIENSTDGRLGSFHRLIMKYGLKTVSICRVDSSDGGSTVFGLMKKYITVPEDDGTKYFGFRLPDTAMLPDVLCAADVCGMRTVNITSVSDGAYDTVLEINDDGICGFLSFLYLEFPDFVPEGIFGMV